MPVYDFPHIKIIIAYLPQINYIFWTFNKKYNNSSSFFSCSLEQWCMASVSSISPWALNVTWHILIYCSVVLLLMNFTRDLVAVVVIVHLQSISRLFSGTAILSLKPLVMNALKCRTLGVYNARAQILESARATDWNSSWLCTLLEALYLWQEQYACFYSSITNTVIRQV